MTHSLPILEFMKSTFSGLVKSMGDAVTSAAGAASTTFDTSLTAAKNSAGKAGQSAPEFGKAAGDAMGDAAQATSNFAAKTGYAVLEDATESLATVKQAATTVGETAISGLKLESDAIGVEEVNAGDMKRYYKTMRQEHYQLDKIINTANYNYGIVAGGATEPTNNLYETILQISDISEVGFYPLILFASQVQKETLPKELGELLSLKDLTLKVNLQKFIKASTNNLTVDGDLLSQLTLAAQNCEIWIESPEASVGLWEYLYELVRSGLFPSAPKRLESCFACNDIQSVINYRKKHGLGEIMCAVDGTKCKVAFEADMRILDDISSDFNMKRALSEVERYWNQEQSENPLLEVLLQGEIKLLESIESASTVAKVPE